MTTDKGSVHNDKPVAANTAKADSTDLILSVLMPHPKAADAKVEPKPAEAKVEPKPAPAGKVEGESTATHKPVETKTASTTLMASSLLLGGNRDVVLPKKADEPAPAATLGSMSTSFKTGFVSNLAHQADGLQTMVSGKMTEQERYEQAKFGIAPERKNALSNLFHTGQNLVVNADKIPGALASQVKDTASALTSGDGNKIASTLGSATAFGLTTFAPVGGLSKAGTAGREAATLANGMREVGTARAVVGQYASANALTKLDDVSALTRLPRIPSSTAMREAATASTNLGKSVLGVVPEAKLATAFRPAGLGDDLANAAAKTTHVVPETALVKPIKPANLVADPVVAAPKTVVPEANLPAALKPGSVADEAANALLKTEGLGLSKPLRQADDLAAGTAGRTNNAGTRQHADTDGLTAKTTQDKTPGSGTETVKPETVVKSEPVVKASDSVVGKTVEPVVVKPQLADDLNSVGTKSTEFTKAIEEAMPNMTTSQRQVAQKLVDDLKVVEQTAKPVPAGAADSVVAAPVEASTRVKSLVDDLSGRPEVVKLIQENPALARHFDDLKVAGGKLESPVVPAKAADSVVPTPLRSEPAVDVPQVVGGRAVEPVVVKPQLADDLNSVGTKSTEFTKAIEEAMPNMTTSQRQVAQKLVDDLKVVEQTAKPVPAGAADSVVAAPVEASTRVKSLVDDLSRRPEVVKLIQENPALARHFDDLKVAGGKLEVPVTPANVETVALKLGDDIGKVGRSTADLTRSIESELPKLSGAQRQVADDIVRDLKSLEEATRPGAVVSPLENSRRIQKLVDDLGKPEYSRFFAENPKFVEGLTEVRVASGNMSRSRNVLETTVVSGERTANTLRLGEEGSRFTAKVEQLSDDLRRVPGSDKAVVNPALKEVPSQSLPLVERELKAIGRDMQSIGTNTDRTIAQVRARLELLEESGAKTLARDLRTNLDDIEKLSLNARTSTRLETATLTVESEGALLSQKATALSRELKPAADLAPSTSAKIPVEAQVSKHLDSLAEQARIVGTSSDPVKAVSNMRNSINKIEELGGVRVLKPEQVKAYEEITAAVTKIDRAAVEIRGVEALRGGASNSIEKLPGLVDDLRTSVRPSVKEELAQNFRRIEEAQAELRVARTLEEQSVANSRLARELDDPKLKTLVEGSSDARIAHSRLVEQVGKIDDAVLLSSRERLLTRVEAQSDNLIQSVRNLEPVPPVVSGPVSKPSPLKLATDDYVQAVNDIRRGADATALRRADQAFANLEFSAARQSIAPEVFAAIKQEHKALTTVSRELSEVSTTLITRNVEKLEQGFSRMEQATSTLVQRGLIKENYNVIQDLRYLEGPKGAGAPRLEDAQNRLIRAANDIEVATYRSNLVKLASHGDQVALDKLLVSGLVPEGRKVISLVPESMSQSLSTRAFLLGFGPEGNMIRNLSAADPFFLNNRGLLLNSTTVGTLKYGLLGAFGYMEAKELSSRIDQALLLEQFEKMKKDREEAQSQERDGADGRSQTPFDPTDNKAAASQAQVGEASQVLPRRAVQFNLNTGVEQTSNQFYAQAGAANHGINPVNAQSVMRNAYAAVVQNRTLPSQNGLTTGAPLKTSGNRERSILNVRFDDPDREQKIFNMATYGTEFGPYRQGAQPSAVDVVPIARAVSFPVTFTYNGDGRMDSRLDKPASSQFVIPSILNATDARLLNLSFSGRRDPYSSNSTALGSGQGIVNASGTSKVVNDGHLYNSLIASEAEGGSGHDARKLAGMEEAEDDVDKAGSGVVASANNGNQDDDDEDGQQNVAPAQVSSGGNVPPLPASVLTGKPVVADAGKARESEKEKVPGPPRKKTITA
ncbi:MAG: hypothetical protein SFV17_25630 [Candidatus Obscuribacter sp.]|nr:hypothetical protein [Candidatus Obscuribacter sp.]